MKDYLNNQAYINLEVSHQFIMIAFGVLEIKNSSYIHDQPALIESFTSILTIRDSEISNVEMITINIKVITSIFNFQNMNINNIRDPLNKNFIFIEFQCTLKAENIVFSDSNSVLFTLFSSAVEIKQVRFKNNNNIPQFIKIQE